MMRIICFLLLASLFLLNCVCEETGPRLLVSKRIHNKFLVEGKDILVQYNIYNVGNRAALRVELVDQSFPEESFEIIGGLLNVKMDRIAPGSNITHVVVLHPKHSGYMNFSAAQVRYNGEESLEALQVGYSSEPGEGGVVAFKDYNRKFSPHILDWAAFAVMTLPSLGIPFLLWFKSKSKYDGLGKVPNKRS